MDKRIAIVDDEEDIVELVSQILIKEGYQIDRFSNGNRLLESLQKKKSEYALLLLDIMLPEINGIEILKIIKNNPDYERYKDTPIIMLSAKDTEADKVVGLELGADDYISKPFSPRELTARVKALLRRADEKLNFFKAGSKIKIAGLTIDENRFIAAIDDVPIELTSAEFKILSMLCKRKGWVFERGKILDTIWNGDKYVTDRTVDVHIKHLREKLGKMGYLIKTVRGIGYKIDDEN